MEPTVLSGPLGLTQTFPLGFQTLDPDNGTVLCQSGQTGLDFRNGDQQDHTSQQNLDKSVFVDKSEELDSLIDVSMFSCGDLKDIQELSCTDKINGLDEISDSALSWLFSPNFPDVIGKDSACNEASLTQDSSLESSAQLISLSVPSSPVKISKEIEINAGDTFLLDLFSNEQSSGELSPQGVSEELGEQSHEERVGLPVTESPETRDKGLFPDQVTDPPDSATLQSLPENCLPLHISSSLECSEGSVPLLDLQVPDTDSCLSLCPASPASVACTGTLSDTPGEESEVLQAEATAITNPTPENQGENNSLAPGLSDEPSPLTLPLADDGLTGDDPTSETNSEEDGAKNLMEDTESQESKDMALDLCLTVEEVHDEDPWDLKPQEESVPDPSAEQLGEETSQPEGPECHQVPSFEFSVQDVNRSSPEAGWTSEQAVETISLSKMVVDDSLPMVSAVRTREEDVSPLKAVFDALDQDGDGFVRIEEFMEFAAAYGADQVKDLTKFLDPSGLGVISFEDFHRGISAISNGGPEPQLYSVGYSPGDGAVSCPEEYDEQNEVTDSAYLGSESTYSECETFTDEDTGALVPPEMHEDVETDSGIEATLHDAEDGGNRFSLNSEHHGHSLVTVLGGEEEHFEDFGESNTSELLLESGVDVADGEADASVAKPPEELDGSSLLSPSAGKRLSSKKVARHLLQNSSMTLDTMSDLTRDILELADNDITDKVLLLERRVAELEKESEASGEQHARLRQENLQLVHRANALEEQLKEQELHADEQIQQEARRHKEALSKLERERGLELENLQARLQQLDEENSELRSCVPCLRANIERLEEEKRKLQDETDSMSDRLQEETESRRKMADKLNHERHQSQKDKECTQELIEDLRKQLEHLQLYKLEAEAKRGRTPGAGLQEYQTRTREAELEQEIKRLKQDNRTLKEQNDELNGQIINLSIQGAKNLMSASFSDSLAAEINSVSRAELMEAVHKQEEINYRLQDYIDKIIVAIMESNPSILEVK
ncbi:rab11 family-interacting protein 3 isoform X2 [Salarias fasciatus]|uniref:RAB11 family interacting protein 3 n=1 Tax=Salarias fasciatus TaxID=181472 RepID=A0A672FPS9_SALFA|nr:rab11 family-interacting protein 3 isoform X2 [Salarias fasciatus]